MILDHAAVYARDLEALRAFYETYFGAKPNAMYHNPRTGLKTYFLSFDGGAQWQPDDGQYVLRFGVQGTAGGIAFFEAPAPAKETGSHWFERAAALESEDVSAACEAYRNALSHDAHHLEAYINLGLCLYNSGNLDEAEKVYRAGLAQCGRDALLLFNLGVLLEDRERYDEAIATYREAVAQSPDFADAHWNLALLCKSRGLAQEALRHLKVYRKLTA
jgi:tetratricopeptide (TPR) repeat protein